MTAPNKPERAPASQRNEVTEQMNAVSGPEVSQAPLSERLWVLLNDACARQALSEAQLCAIDEARVLARSVETAETVLVMRGENVPTSGEILDFLPFNLVEKRVALVEVPNV